MSVHRYLPSSVAFPAAIRSALRILLALAAGVATLRFGVGLAAWRVANNLESPPYEVVRRLASPPNAGGRGGEIELRRYDSYLVAETMVEESSMREAGGRGFGLCAGYIFGKNVPRRGDGGAEKMAMTSPVRTAGDVGEKMAMTSPVRSSGNAGRSFGDGKGGGKTRVSFVVGSKYDMSTVPKPLDPAVKIREVKGHYLAARTFSGPPPSDERVRGERRAIEEALDGAGVRIEKNGGETMVYGYHDPMITPNFLRRNEVAVMVDGSSVC